MKRALVTGAAGFIGSHLAESLLEGGWSVTGLDNFDAFYGRDVKTANLAGQMAHPSFELMEADIRDHAALMEKVNARFDVIVHLAGKAGVRPSIEDPVGYQHTNVIGTQNLLELARVTGTSQFVFASSSSVYGVNPRVPWSEEDHVLEPISPYASTKVSGELLGHVYSRLYGIRFVALRFFTVYGPRQRPDLAIHKFARKMLRGEPIPIFGDGTTRRDYTFVDDTVAGIRAAIDYTDTPYEVINLGNNQTVSLAEMVEGLEDVLEVPAIRQWLPEQAGDVPQTWANIDKARRLLGYRPRTPYRDGVRKFADWLTPSRSASISTAP